MSASLTAVEYRYHKRHYRGGNYRVELSVEALKTIAATYERSAEERLEYSAILVGHYSDDCTTAIVDQLICELRGEPYQVVQSAEYATSVSTALREIWDSESGCRYYLGDWHTHPLNMKTPSGVDIETSRERASDPKTQCPQLLMAITGDDGTSVHVVTSSGMTQLLPDDES